MKGFIEITELVLAAGHPRNFLINVRHIVCIRPYDSGTGKIGTFIELSSDPNNHLLAADNYSDVKKLIEDALAN